MVFKGTLRAVKNITNGYSDAEAKVRTVTSSESDLPSGAQMHELAEMSFNHEDFIDIVTMLDKRLNDKGKYWRHVYKSLTVLEYLLHSGSPKVAQYFRDNIYLIKTLTEFQHIDDNGRDVGADVRARARELSRLLADDKSLADARRRRKQMRDRMTGKQNNGSDDETSESQPRPQQAKRPSREEQDFQRALQLSEEEEADRQRQLAEQSKEGLFDDPKPAPSNLIDLTIDESQPWQLQPQMTTVSYSPYYPTAVHSQLTAFDPYAQQAQYEAMLQAEYARQQAEAADQQQQYYALQLQFQAAQLQASQQSPLVPQKSAFGSVKPFPSITPRLPHAHLLVQSSNNPFASNNPFGQPTPVPTPQLSQSPLPRTERGGRPPSTASVSSRASSLAPRTPVSSRADALSAILTSAGPGGVDTFGNVGPLRYGSSAFGRAAQRTATGL
ncbi:ENTH-domain-containing protein [Russula earlei]|uniref:ENTH-domain-containing protein n=1 Tax=Russula earlei TaxID=71964 RepID=A0ACC0TXJ3_9AGAM|nr:ENTH-domain-containing protein [Russula earlei]